MKKITLLLLVFIALFSACNSDQNISIFEDVMTDVPQDEANNRRVMGRYNNQLVITNIQGISIEGETKYQKNHIEGYFVIGNNAYFIEDNTYYSIDLSSAEPTPVKVDDIAQELGIGIDFDRIYDIRYFEKSEKNGEIEGSYSVLGESGKGLDRRYVAAAVYLNNDGSINTSKSCAQRIPVNQYIIRGTIYLAVPRIIGPDGAYSYYEPSTDRTDEDDYPFYYKTNDIRLPKENDTEIIRFTVNGSGKAVETYFDGVAVGVDGSIYKYDNGSFTRLNESSSTNTNIGESYSESIQMMFPMTKYDGVIYGLNQYSTRRYFSYDTASGGNEISIHSISSYSHYDCLGLYYYGKSGSGENEITWFYFPTGGHSMRYLNVNTGSVQYNKPTIN